jgi:UDPglucose--hexose-1-phosphate uridylyltransferase
MKIEINEENKKQKTKGSKSKKDDVKKGEVVSQSGKKLKATESELRQDIVTGDWVVIATGRAKRPEDFVSPEKQNLNDDISKCLFCDPESTGQEKDVLIYLDENDSWSLRVFPNKYPALSRGRVPSELGEGPYFSMTGTGYHEVFVTRDHYKHLPDLDVLEIAEVFDAFSDRYVSLMGRKSVNFVSIFHNYGKAAGASISHPHSQLVAIPVVSPYIKLELNGAERYYKSNKKCVYCVMTEYESEAGTRMIFENDEFIAFCPFSSRAAFEVWVVPKKHNPFFEKTNNDEKVKLAEVMKKALSAIKEALGDPAYNFYIHTAPCDGKYYTHYHWHIEILPHTATWAGFELETGIEISTIQPETAAEHLKKFI